MHLKPTAGCQLSTLILGFGDFGNFSWDIYRVAPEIQISKLIFDTLLWA
jgi:hypothetical protein